MVTATAMSAASCAVVSSVLALLLVFGSKTAEVQLAELVHTPGVGRTTWRVTVACAWDTRLPIEQLTMPADSEQVP